MYASVSLTSVYVLFLCLHWTTGKQLPSQVQSDIRVISDLLNGQQEPMTQQSSLDIYADATSDEDDSNKSPLSEDARMDMWRKRLELCRNWIDQMSARHPKPKPKLFARLSRGRLDRMPLSYGKRSTTDDSRTHFYSDDGYVRVAKERLSRMPFTYGKRQADLHALTDLDSKLREEIQNRLDGTATDYSGGPTSSSSVTVFGQFSGEPFTRTQRDRLTRMPLTYGKRLWSGYKDLAPYSRSERGRLDRMPLTYGKRSGVATTHNCKDGVNFEDFTDLLRGLDSAEENGMAPSTLTPIGVQQWTEDGTEAGEYEGEVPLTRLPRSKLQRMPFSFGKRRISPLQGEEHVYVDDAIQTLKLEDLQNIDRRSRMDRMPVNFGKRSKSVTHHVKRLRLDRMPMAFGKRGGERHSPLTNLGGALGEISLPNYKETFISGLDTEGNTRNLDTRPHDDEAVPTVESNASPASLR